MAKTNNKKENQIDPRRTVEYYSMYQTFGDVLSMTLVCFLVLALAIVIVAALYMLIVSDHPTLNLFYIMERLAELFIKLVLAAIKWIVGWCATL